MTLSATAEPRRTTLRGMSRPASDPVGLVEIAQRTGTRLDTARQWRHRRVLPEPLWKVSGAPAWDWPQIVTWMKETGRWKDGMKE